MLQIILIILALIVLGVLFLAYRKPDNFRIERNLIMQATPSQIFPHINSLKAHQAWSPWEGLDPNMTRDITGPESGVGAHYAWSGNKQVGSGSMLINRSILDQSVDITLTFNAPMKAVNLVEFKLEPTAEGTRVHHAMSGKSPFTAKLFHVFVSMEGMIGPMFEKGLHSLKGIVEAKS
jgi:hypothetical protein